MRRGVMKRSKLKFARVTLFSWGCVLAAISAMAVQFGIPPLHEKLIAASHAEPEIAMAASASSPVIHVRHAASQVYRLIVDVGDSVKGGTAFLVSGRRIVAT